MNKIKSGVSANKVSANTEKFLPYEYDVTIGGITTRFFKPQYLWTKAEEFRYLHCQTTNINGWASENWNCLPEDAIEHYHSDDVEIGYVFPDRSEIWRTCFGEFYTIKTQRARESRDE